MTEQLFVVDDDSVNRKVAGIFTADQDEADDDVVEADDDDDDFDDEDDVDDEDDDEEAAEEAIAPSGRGALTPPAANPIDQPTSPDGAASGRPAVDDGHGIPKL